MKTLITLLCLYVFSTAVNATTTSKITALNRSALILEDVDGIPHIFAHDEHDMLVLQGWVHARDRLFQMDVLRRRGSGTLAELLGPDALPTDVESRVVGIRRAAEASLPLASAETLAGLEAYAAGVNSYVETSGLPPEYAALEITQFEPWSALDSLTVGRVLIFRINFELEDIERSQALGAYVAAFGEDRAQALYFEDLFRSAPLFPASTIPDASMAHISVTGSLEDDEREEPDREHKRSWRLTPKTLEMGRRYIERIKDHPVLKRSLQNSREGRGSNEWAVSPELTKNGRTLIANDVHLELDSPALWYEIHLRALKAGFNATGSSLPGVPYVLLGHNQHTSWGATIHFMDVTDVYQEQIVPDPTSPSGLSTLFMGNPEHILPLPQQYRFNAIGDGVPDTLVIVPPDPNDAIPEVVLIMPRRNHGPIVDLDPATGSAISVQYTGFSGSRELDTFRAWNLARDIDNFVEGLKSFDTASLNWAYADVDGNIAYFVSGEMPLREDLQANTVVGLPPFLIRNGAGGNEWIQKSVLPPDQAIPFEIIPFDEMPQKINPPAGYFVNGNNDPDDLNLDNDPFNRLRPGGGLYYLSGRYNFGARAERITELLDEILRERPLSFEDMQRIQADVVMLDAREFTPYIIQAFKNSDGADTGSRLSLAAASAGVAEAVERIANWDFSTPTGIPQGYDASDSEGIPDPDVPNDEVANSIAATIYSVWRGQFIQNTIDRALGPLPGPESEQALTALKNLLDNFEARGPSGGIGLSGVNFFDVAGETDPLNRRDIIILESLRDALKLLASDEFALAFGKSTDQNDYRWGKLHRITFASVLGGPFNTPPAGGAFLPPIPTLAGIPVDGGFEVVDASNHPARADGLDEFNFSRGPTRRYVAELGPWPGIVRADSSLPGGQSGVLGDPNHVDLLARWLTNDTYPLRLKIREILRDLEDVEFFRP